MMSSLPPPKRAPRRAASMRLEAAKNASRANNTRASTAEPPPLPKKSLVVTLKLPSFREALRNLERTRRRPSEVPPTPVLIEMFVKDIPQVPRRVLFSKDRFIAWLLEDPDPNPPMEHHQEPSPSQQTKFEFSSLYNTRSCMWGCSGQPPGTGCPTCNPVDFQQPLKSARPEWDGN